MTSPFLRARGWTAALVFTIVACGSTSIGDVCDQRADECGEDRDECVQIFEDAEARAIMARCEPEFLDVLSCDADNFTCNADSSACNTENRRFNACLAFDE